MRLEVSATKLYEAILKADRLTSRKAALPILAGIFIKAQGKSIVIRSTNLEVGIEMTINGDILEEGEIVIDSNLLKSFLSSSSKDQVCKIEKQDSSVNVSVGANQARITLLDPTEFPSLPKISESEGIKVALPAHAFIEGIQSVWYSAATSSMKPELSSIYIYSEQSELYFVATDSFRLAEKTVAANIPETFSSLLIPYKNALEVSRLLDEEKEVELNIGTNLATFSQKGLILTSRLVDGVFPDYKQIIPKEFQTETTILKYDLESSLRLSSLFADRFYQVTIDFRPRSSELIIQSKGTESGQTTSTLKAKVEGDPLVVKFNQRYVSDSLQAITDETVVLKLSPGKPMIMRGVKDSTFRYLVMPMHS